MVNFQVVNNSQRSVIVAEVVFCIVPALAVALRVRGRQLRKRSLDGSDYCIIVALVLTIAFLGLGIAAVLHCGVGLHMSDIIEQYGMAPIVTFLKMLIAVQFLWATSLALIKASILLFYLQIFNVSAFRLAARLTGVFIGLWALAVIFCGFFMCRPFAYSWDQTIPGGKCGDQVLSYVVTGALNLVSDVIVLLLPMPHIWKLQLPLFKKVVLTVAFAIGIFTCIISILRLVSLQELSYTDITYDIPLALIWGTLEPAIGITLACVPMMRPIFIRNPSSVHSNTHGEDSRNNKGGVDKSFGSSFRTSKNFHKLESDQHPLKLQDMAGSMKSETTVRKAPSVSTLEHEEEPYATERH